MAKDTTNDRWLVKATDIKTDEKREFLIERRWPSAAACQEEFERTHGKLFKVTSIRALARDGTPLTPETFKADVEARHGDVEDKAVAEAAKK